MRIVLCIALWLGLATSCRPEPPDTTETRRERAAQRAIQAQQATEHGAEAIAAMTAPLQLDPETAARVVARIGEDTITLGDVARHISEQPRHLRARYSTVAQKRVLLQHLVEVEVLSREAKAKGFDQHPVVQHALKQALAKQVLRHAALEGNSVAHIDEGAVRAHYEAHKDSYVQAARWRAGLIVLADESAATAMHQELTRALAATPELAGAIFGDFAAEKSMDRETREVRGDLGWFDKRGSNDRGQIRVGETVLAQVLGVRELLGVSRPFEMEGKAWAVVQLTGKRETRIQSFEDVQLQIRGTLLGDRQKGAVQAFIEDLKARTEIQVDEGALAQLAQDSAAGAPPDQPGPSPVRLAPGATRRGLVPRIGKSPRQIQRAVDPSIRATVEEIQEKMRRDKKAEEDKEATP